MPRTDVRGITHHSIYEEDCAMNLVRFIGLLFVFIGVLASCAVAVQAAGAHAALLAAGASHRAGAGPLPPTPPTDRAPHFLLVP
ncbi:hypothetical protein ACPA9J_08815 [Pseudomonas aeruginosa]